MRIRERGMKLEVRTTPGCYWLFGLWFIAGGAVAMLMPFIASNADRVPWWARVVGLAIGAGCAGGGVFLISQYPWVRAELDRSTGYGCVWSGHLRRRRTDFLLRDVHAVALDRTTDSDGDEMFRVDLVLRDGRSLPLMPQHAFGREWALARAEALRLALRLREPVRERALPPGSSRS